MPHERHKYVLTRKHLVLVGAGHGHLYLLARADELRQAGYDITLVDPGDFWYSGLAPGTFGGAFDLNADRIDIAKLCATHDVRRIPHKMTGLDQRSNQVNLGDHTQQSYDVLSLNVGSEVRPPFTVHDPGTLFTAKPIPRLFALKAALETYWHQSDVVHVGIVGGGASGSELACNLAGLARRHKKTAEITVLDKSAAPMAKSPASVRRHMTRALQAFSISYVGGVTVDAQDKDGLHVSNGEVVECDFSLVATGLAAPLWLQDLGLPFDKRRGLQVQESLQSSAEPCVFAIGDCADIADYALPKVGVFGVRAAPVLHRNLISLASHKPLQTYTPQKRWLAAQNLGDGTGLIWWDNRLGSSFCPSWRSSLALHLKNFIDFRFMDSFGSKDLRTS